MNIKLIYNFYDYYHHLQRYLLRKPSSIFTNKAAKIRTGCWRFESRFERAAWGLSPNRHGHKGPWGSMGLLGPMGPWGTHGRIWPQWAHWDPRFLNRRFKPRLEPAIPPVRLGNMPQAPQGTSKGLREPRNTPKGGHRDQDQPPKEQIS